jgi:hypothetical protein
LTRILSLESDWFQSLNLKSVLLVSIQAFCFQIQLVRPLHHDAYTPRHTASGSVASAELWELGDGPGPEPGLLSANAQRAGAAAAAATAAAEGAASGVAEGAVAEGAAGAEGAEVRLYKLNPVEST